MKLLMIFVIISFLIACDPLKKKSQITPETPPPIYTPNIEGLQLESRTKDDKLISEEEYQKILNEINNKYGKIVWQDELMSK